MSKLTISTIISELIVGLLSETKKLLFIELNGSILTKWLKRLSVLP